MARGHDYEIISDVAHARTKLYAWLGSLSAVLAALLHKEGQKFVEYLFGSTASKDLGWLTSLITSIGAMSIFAGLIWAFRNYVWKWPLALPFYILTGAKRPPVLLGNYEGTLTWYNTVEDEKGRSSATVSILQSWDQMLVQFKFSDEHGMSRAESNSEIAILEMGLDPNRVTLKYIYRYSAAENAYQGKGIDKTSMDGTASLHFWRVNGKWKVDGNYYSDDRGSGKITLSQVS